MIKVNLAPKKYVQKIYSSVLVAKIILIAITVIVVLSLLSFFHYHKFKSLELNYKNLEAKRNFFQKQIDESKKIDKEIEDIKKYISAVEKISKNRFFYVAFMQDLVNNLPQTVWFSGIDTKTRVDGLDVIINLNSNSLEDMLWWYAFIEQNKKRYSELKIESISFNGSFYNTQIKFKYNYVL
ncbi:MAG: hypothetical protein K6357_06705 [Elusimicrobiota bacterium]